jgi:hypothetical protein
MQEIIDGAVNHSVLIVADMDIDTALPINFVHWIMVLKKNVRDVAKHLPVGNAINII